jgi:hypothetical protein
LWPLEWTENAPEAHTPLATLWHPQLVRISHFVLLVRGFEGVPVGRSRRWYTQKWMCEVMEATRARQYLRPDPRFGEI